MAKQEHLDLLKQGSDPWNAWRKQHQSIRLDLIAADLRRVDLTKANLRLANFTRANLRRAYLSEADLERANLERADLTRARLRGANLRGANLIETNLIDADLTKVDLRGAHLRGANLKGANLIEADLKGADLGGTDLSNADLKGANLANAQTWSTVFANVDLSDVKGLATVRHSGPSSIGVDTIYRSGGEIPEGFLRGAGIPNTFLDYMHSLVGKAIQYFACFISYSSKDQLFCNRLYADLQAKGIRTWYFKEDATWGKPVWGEIEHGIKLYDKLVVVCSKQSLQSGPVLREVERALQREDKEGKHVLFPIRLDDYLFEQWEHERKADILNKVVGDFRGWNRSAEEYEASFKKFLQALRAPDESTC